jgi:hypothetical protein
MNSFLVCYDYGQGGVWFYLEAASLEEITQTYPRLTAFGGPPPWWNEQHEKAARDHDPEKSPYSDILSGALPRKARPGEKSLDGLDQG